MTMDTLRETESCSEFTSDLDTDKDVKGRYPFPVKRCQQCLDSEVK